MLTFDKLSSVFISNTNHSEDQPIHLRLKTRIRRFRSIWPSTTPEQRYCPAGVYEIVREGRHRAALADQRPELRALQDLRHQRPTQNINWSTPEGGGGRTTSICKVPGASLSHRAPSPAGARFFVRADGWRGMLRCTVTSMPYCGKNATIGNLQNTILFIDLLIDVSVIPPCGSQLFGLCLYFHNVNDYIRLHDVAVSCAMHRRSFWAARPRPTEL